MPAVDFWHGIQVITGRERPAPSAQAIRCPARKNSWRWITRPHKAVNRNLVLVPSSCVDRFKRSILRESHLIGGQCAGQCANLGRTLSGELEAARVRESSKCVMPLAASQRTRSGESSRIEQMGYAACGISSWLPPPSDRPVVCWRTPLDCAEETPGGAPFGENLRILTGRSRSSSR